MAHDLTIRGGTIIDGTGAVRFVGDIAIDQGQIAAIGTDVGTARKTLHAAGLVVAPGVIDLHTHYDAQLHWDPYCTTSSWHGTTSVVIGNCGFGFAPVRPGMSDRYMRMMENTEQVPYEVMKRSMPWNWESFPDWLDHLRRLPKGINVASYLPMNALLSFVIGPDEAKLRPATAEERKRMRELLEEAMDAGASGFGFSFLGAEGNSHVDHDQSPMPSDVMSAEEAYNLARVLADRGEGTIQVLCELPGMSRPRRDVAEQLAKISGRPVLHNILLGSDTDPEQHRSILRWLDEVRAKKLNIWSQCFSFRKPLEISPMHYNVWDSIPVFRTFSAASSMADKMKLARDPQYRQRMRDEYDPKQMSTAGGQIEDYVVVRSGGSSTAERYLGCKLCEIAAKLGMPITDVFLDLLVESNMSLMFSNNENGTRRIDVITEILRHPRVLAGISDGGAHSKHGNGGYWSTDLLLWLTRETKAFTAEEVHHLLSGRNAEAFGFEGRGLLKTGYAADIIIYDPERLDYQPRGHYEVVHDLPGGDWRKVTRALGIRYCIVNGQITFEDGECTGAVPGRVISNKRSNARAFDRAV